MNRMVFKNLITEYGDIMCASSDGLNFLLYNKSKDSVTIVRFYENDFKILKTFRIKKLIDDFLDRVSSKEKHNEMYTQLWSDE